MVKTQCNAGVVGSIPGYGSKTPTCFVAEKKESKKEERKERRKKERKKEKSIDKDIMQSVRSQRTNTIRLVQK